MLTHDSVTGSHGLGPVEQLLVGVGDLSIDHAADREFPAGWVHLGHEQGGVDEVEVVVGGDERRDSADLADRMGGRRLDGGIDLGHGACGLTGERKGDGGAGFGCRGTPPQRLGTDARTGCDSSCGSGPTEEGPAGHGHDIGLRLMVGDELIRIDERMVVVADGPGHAQEEQQRCDPCGDSHGGDHGSRDRSTLGVARHGEQADEPEADDADDAALCAVPRDPAERDAEEQRKDDRAGDECRLVGQTEQILAELHEPRRRVVDDLVGDGDDWTGTRSRKSTDEFTRGQCRGSGDESGDAGACGRARCLGERGLVHVGLKACHDSIIPEVRVVS